MSDENLITENKTIEDNSEDQINNNAQKLKNSLILDDGRINTNAIITNLISIALPTMLFYFCLIAQQSILLSFISSEYDDEEQKFVINGIGISNMYFNCTLVSLVVGLMAGFNVLGSNALSLKKNKLFGLYFHRAIIVAYSFAFVLIIFHNITMSYGFQLLGADDKSLDYAMTYGRISIYFVLFEVLFNAGYRYLNIARKGFITILVLIVTTLLHPLWCFLFIRVFNLGVPGAAMSIVFSQFLTGMSIFIFILVKKPIPDTIFCISKDSFKSIKSFLSLSIPAMFLLCFEWWAFEIQQIIVINCGRDDWESELSVQIMSATIYSLLYSVTVGFTISSSINCGKYIASGNIKHMKFSSVLNLLMSILFVGTFSLIIFILRDKIFWFFTDNYYLVEKGRPVLPYVIATVFLNTIKSTLQGIMTGLRRQLIASIFGFISYYVVMVVLSIIFVIVLDYGVIGVWIAEVIGYCFMITLYVIYIFRLDFEKVVIETQERIKKDNDALHKIFEEEVKNEEEKLVNNEL